MPTAFDRSHMGAFRRSPLGARNRPALQWVDAQSTPACQGAPVNAPQGLIPGDYVGGVNVLQNFAGGTEPDPFAYPFGIIGLPGNYGGVEAVERQVVPSEPAYTMRPSASFRASCILFGVRYGQLAWHNAIGSPHGDSSTLGWPPLTPASDQILVVALNTDSAPPDPSTIPGWRQAGFCNSFVGGFSDGGFPLWLWWCYVAALASPPAFSFTAGDWLVLQWQFTPR